MKISYAFTCGRLETVFKLSNYLKFGEKNDAVKEKEIVEQYRAAVSSGHPFEETALYKATSEDKEKIVENRLKNIIRENSGNPSEVFSANEYRSGAWHELDDYKMAVRFFDAKEMLDKKHLAKIGMHITVRDISAMTGWNPTNIKNLLNHKRAAVKSMVEKLEKLAKEY
ncbi:hypothetical protein R4575_16715 [Acinetobacter baumannii]|nr:hypothetical protein [Acinetobacter baumannii]